VFPSLSPYSRIGSNPFATGGVNLAIYTEMNGKLERDSLRLGQGNVQFPE
jgi:hypothetical protein